MAVASSIQDKINLETYTLIWLDRSADESRETISAQQSFRTTINYIKIFKQSDECLKYIQSLTNDDRVIMIVSGRLGQEIVPQIHQYRQVSAIYVYCMNKKNNEQWVQPYNKIKHIIVNLDELIRKIRDQQIERQRNKVQESFPIHIYQSNPINKRTNESFLYTYVLINCLIQTNSDVNDKNDLISICKKQYEGNEIELKFIEEFEQNYFPSRALWWYTRPTFLYRILKKALQIQNIEILLLYRFFIRDIQRQLEKTKCTTLIHVYCGQILSNEDFEILKTNINECIIINSFLSTGSQQYIRECFNHIEFSNDLQRVLFEIDADPSLENIKPFSNIKSQSYNTNDDQTLFMLGSIFRLNHIQQEHNGIWRIRMTLCSENDLDIKSIYDQNSIENALSFGKIFCRLKQFNTAEIYYQHILKGLPIEHEDIISCYDALGNLENQKDNYDLSLQYFNKALEIRMKILQSDHQDIGDSYLNIGEIYQKKNDSKQAFDLFNRAITIYSKTLNNDHPKIATCFDNMGHVYMNDKKFSKALEFYEKALSIRRKCFAETHQKLADSFKNVGTANEYLKSFDQALDNYNRAVRIYEKASLPLHFTIGSILEKMGNILENKKEFEQARLSYEKALRSFCYILSPTDEHITQIQQDIQRVTGKLK